jgi:hypothetical protein
MTVYEIVGIEQYTDFAGRNREASIGLYDSKQKALEVIGKLKAEEDWDDVWVDFEVEERLVE